MSHDHDGVKDCYVLGHLYSNITVMRCPHREGFNIVAQVWRDTEHDGTVTIWEHSSMFGPFDDAEYIRKVIGDIAETAASHLQLADPVAQLSLDL